MATVYKTKKLARNVRGEYQCDLGRNSDGKPQRLYLGVDAASAVLRRERLRRLWGIVLKDGNDHWPKWELSLAKSIARGEMALLLPNTMPDRPDLLGAYASAIDDMASRLNEILVVLPADQEGYRAGKQANQATSNRHAQEVNDLAAKHRQRLAQFEQEHWESVRQRDESFGLPAPTIGRLEADGEPTLLHDALDAFAGHLKGEARLINPETRELTDWGLNQLRMIERLKEKHENVPLGQIDLTAIKAMANYWRSRPLAKGRKTPISALTAKHHIWMLKTFFWWVHEQRAYHWSAPMELQRIALKAPKTAAEKQRIITSEQVAIWSIDELAAIYKTATDLERVYLLLGLNCGFGPGEFGTLTLEQIFLRQRHPQERLLGFKSRPDQSWIRRVRNKSIVYGEWLLWPETVRAIDWALERRKTITKTKTGTLMLTEDGNSYTGRTTGQNHSARISNLWRKTLDRARKNGNSQLRTLPAKSLRKTAGNLIRDIAGGEIMAIFLSHGQVCGDDLAEVYSNRPWRRVWEAIEGMHDRLATIWQTAKT